MLEHRQSERSSNRERNHSQIPRRNFSVVLNERGFLVDLRVKTVSRHNCVVGNTDSIIDTQVCRERHLDVLEDDDRTVSASSTQLGRETNGVMEDETQSIMSLPNAQVKGLHGMRRPTSSPHSPPSNMLVWISSKMGNQTQQASFWTC